LIEFFNVSVPQASLDLAKYQELAPRNTEYDRTAKTYVASPFFSPIIAATDAHAYLDQVLGLQLGIVQSNSSFLGTSPPTGAVKDPSRRVNPSTLRAVLTAIKHRRTVEIEYQSMSTPAPSTRTISPHAIVFDGFRWHVRAFCHRRNDFLDFVFARILKIAPGDNSLVDPLADSVWQREVEVTILPHPELPEGQKRALELDYGMQEGRLVLRTREALLLYLLEHLRVLHEPGDLDVPKHLLLENREALKPFFKSHGLGNEQRPPE
jgi:hypothetical protein